MISFKDMCIWVIIVALLTLCGVQMVKHGTYTYQLNNQIENLQADILQLELEYNDHIMKLYQQDKETLELLKGYQEQLIKFYKPGE